MKIGEFELGWGRRPMIVAEIGAAHNGSLDTAMRLVELAHEAGADAIKLQCYTPDTITIDSDRDEFIIKNGPWKGMRMYDLYTQAHMPRHWFPPLFARAARLNIPMFASVFSIEDLDFIKEFRPPAYKIASCELVDAPLINAVANEGGPIILSTGMANEEEILGAAGDVMGRTPEGRHRRDSSNLIVLHCIAEYPAKVDRANMALVRSLQRDFTQVGFSDHSRDDVLAIEATSMGAVMIEKHITLTPNGSGLDDGFAIGQADFAIFSAAIHRAHAAMGYAVAPKRTDVTHLPLRRSLYVVEDVMKGQLLSTFNVRSIRPGAGMAPRLFTSVIGQRARRDIARGTPLQWELIEQTEGGE